MLVVVVVDGGIFVVVDGLDVVVFVSGGFVVDVAPPLNDSNCVFICLCVCVSVCVRVCECV